MAKASPSKREAMARGWIRTSLLRRMQRLLLKRVTLWIKPIRSLSLIPVSVFVCVLHRAGNYFWIDDLDHTSCGSDDCFWQ
jgi:hypothetical protein